MKTVFLLANRGYVCGLLILVCISFVNAYTYTPGGPVRAIGFSDFTPHTGPPMIYKYDRVDEVKKECSSILASATAMRPNDNRAYSIREELSFVNGDWWQDLNGSPLMPFDGTSGLSFNGSEYVQSPLNLVSFWVTDVDRAHRSKNWVSVSGVLRMGISLWQMFDQKPDERNPRFNIWPSHSELSISFKGAYTESEGEKVMCLLGNTLLPTRYPEAGNQWEWMKEGYNSQPPLSQDDQILLVLRYPKTFTLTNRAIQGSMKSLNSKSSSVYFDQVHMSSCLGTSANYEFGSEKILSTACNPYPYKDTLLSFGIDIYKGLDFCLILERFTRQEAFDIMPNWRCNGTDDFCSKLGPFVSDTGIKSRNESFSDFKLVIQDFRCEEKSSRDTTGLTKVSAVFRAFSVGESPFNAAQRTGLNNMTLSAEGIWKPSSGQLCMVGCQGNICDSRICLYVPLSFSIEQRSIVIGTLSSTKEGLQSYFPLTFKKPVRPSELFSQYTSSYPYYKYSKLDLAGTVLEKNEPFSFGTVIKRSFLTFPKLEDTDSFQLSLSYLSEDLTLQISAVPDPVPSFRPPRTDIQLEVLSIGPLFGRYWSTQNESFTEEELPYHAKAEFTERQLLLNISAQLVITGKLYNLSTLFVEGIYDQHVGKMYLIGCRDVGVSWKLLSEGMELEAGLDCLIEVVVEYPPTTTRWLINPTARISISSQRTEDDPLYFSPIKLQTLPLMYRKQREDILSRRGVEGIFRVLTLSGAIACILSQLFYIKNHMDSVPYMSLVMLGVQALGYGIPLITGAEALLHKSKESYETPSYDLENSQWIRVIDYSVKLLVLVSFSLTLRLYQKVWRSRIRLLTRAPLEPHRVPSDKLVFIVTLIIHIVGYGSVLTIHSMKTSKIPMMSDRYFDSTGNNHNLQGWETELEEYVGLVQDFFLLPQVMANLIWQINCKPLRKNYFIGVTVVRLLPHIYDYIRNPVPNPYFSEDYEFANPNLDFYSKFGDIAIPATAVFLAVAVYVQQRWSYDKLSQILVLGKFKLLPFRSRVYERLPSVVVETELTSDGNANAAMRKELEEE